MYEQCLIDKLNHVFSINCIFVIWKGGTGVLPRKILKTTKAGEAISGHFVGTILPSVNEQFQRILLPFIVCPFLNIKFRQICILLYSTWGVDNTV